jgi:hypothetical protein
MQTRISPARQFLNPLEPYTPAPASLAIGRNGRDSDDFGSPIVPAKAQDACENLRELA